MSDDSFLDADPLSNPQGSIPEMPTKKTVAPKPVPIELLEKLAEETDELQSLGIDLSEPMPDVLEKELEEMQAADPDYPHDEDEAVPLDEASIARTSNGAAGSFRQAKQNRPLII